MVENGKIGFGHFWVIFGLLGFLSTFVTGVAILKPLAEKAAVIIAEHVAPTRPCREPLDQEAPPESPGPTSRCCCSWSST